MKRKQILFALMVLLLAGCATNTELMSVSMDKASKGSFKKVFVIAISDDDAVRTMVEQSIATEITSGGAQAIVSSTVMLGALASMKKEDLRAKAEAAVKKAGADSAFVAVLLKDEVREQYVSPRIQEMPVPTTPVYMGFGSYVGYQHETVVTPGYFDKQRQVFVQASLFDASTGTPVWRAQSKTIDPTDLNTSVKGFSSIVVERLQRDGMLAAPKGNNAPRSSSRY